MQLAVAALDPGLDAFSVIGKFLLRGVGERLRDASDPQKLFYEAQKLKVRVNRLIESVERMTGARPGGTDAGGVHRLGAGSRRRSCAPGAALSWRGALTAGAVAWLASTSARSRGRRRLMKAPQQDALVACLSRSDQISKRSSSNPFRVASIGAALSSVPSRSATSGSDVTAEETISSAPDERSTSRAARLTVEPK